MSNHDELIERLRASAAAMPFDAAVAVQYRAAADALEAQAREIEGLLKQDDAPCIDEITLELHPGPLARELKVMRGMASCGGDDESIQQAEIDLHRLQHIESAALLALGMLWMTERHSPNAQAAFQTLRNALGGQDALRRGIEAAIDAGFEADHPPGADWWAGKKEGKP